MLTSKRIKEIVEKYVAIRSWYTIEIIYDAVMKKTPPLQLLLFWKDRGAVPPLFGVPAYRYQHSVSRCITCQDGCVQQSHAEKRINYRNMKWTLEDWLPCNCYAMKTKGTTIRSQVSQPASEGKGADMSELQTHHCMIPVNLALVQCECHAGKQTVVARNKSN